MKIKLTIIAATLLLACGCYSPAKIITALAKDHAHVKIDVNGWGTVIRFERDNAGGVSTNTSSSTIETKVTTRTPAK